MNVTSNPPIAPPPSPAPVRPAAAAPADQGAAMRELLRQMVARKASDLFLVAGRSPAIRVNGELMDLPDQKPLTPAQTAYFIANLLSEKQRQQLQQHADIDLSFGVPELARFRASIYRQRGSLAMAVRQVPYSIPSLDSLGLPAVVSKLATRRRGLVLVTGPAGSGKSTTLAAMVDKINHERRGHIITLEDPIEFVHSHAGCIVSQREIGEDAGSFADALKHALRESPDVLLVGEMRDRETMAATLTIAELGHLALATLHTNSAPESILRIVDVFPAEQQAQIRMQLAEVVEGVITQQLVPRADGQTRVCACEVMLGSPAIRSLIRENHIHQIPAMMEASRREGMQTMVRALHDLCASGTVTAEEALMATDDPGALARMLQLSGHLPATVALPHWVAST